MQALTSMVCRIHFLDGQTRGVGIELNETACETLVKVQEKIELASLDGWALYEVKSGAAPYVGHELLILFLLVFGCSF